MKKYLQIKSVWYIGFASLVSALLIILNINFFPYTFSIEFSSPINGNMQIFYSSNEPYSESNSLLIPIEASTNFIDYSVKLTQQNINHLRIDPPGDFNIKSVSFYNRFHSYQYEGNELFEKIKPLHDIESINLIEDHIVGKINGNDPYLHFVGLPVVNEVTFIKYLGFFIVAFLLSCISICLISYYSKTLIKLVSNLYSKIPDRNTTFIFLNLLITLIIFSFPPESFLYFKFIVLFPFVFLFPGYLILLSLLKNNKKFDYLTIFLLSISLSVSLFITIIFLLDEYKIQTNFYVIYFTPIIILLFLNLKNFKNKNIIVSNDSISWKYFFVFNIMLVAFILPTKGLWVAPLHDPVANSFIALYLINHSYSETPPLLAFYPPGMSYFIALFSDISNISTAKTVLITTNLFNLLSGFSFALFLSKLFSKKKMFPIFLFSFSFLSLFVTSLYFTAGKNSQIVGYFMVFCSLFLYAFSQKQGVGLILMSYFIMISAVLIHYNNITLLAFFVPLIFIKANWHNKSIKSIVKNGVIQIATAIPLLIILLLLFLRIENFKGVNDSNLGLTSNINFSWHVPELNEIWLFIKGSCSGYITLLFSLLGAVMSLVLLCVKRKSRFMIMVAFLLFVFFFIIASGKLGHFSRFVYMNIYIIGVIFSSIFIYSLIKLIKLPIVKSIIYASLLIYGTIRITEIYNEYQNARRFSVVSSADLLAFDWIKQNTSEDEFFLPASIKRRPYPHQSYQLDAAMYLKVLANREDAVTFISGSSFLHNDYEIRFQYDKLINNPTNQESINYFCSKNIIYIYDGAYKPWGNPDVNPEIFTHNPEIFQVVYDTLDVKIYKINRVNF